MTISDFLQKYKIVMYPIFCPIIFLPSSYCHFFYIWAPAPEELSARLSLLKYIFSEITVLLLHYCGWRSSRLNAIQVKMFQFIPNTLYTFLWAMSHALSQIIHYFFSQFCSNACSKQLANQWIVSQISLNDSFSSVSHLKQAVLTQSCNRKFKNIKSIERRGAWPVPGGMPVPRHN